MKRAANKITLLNDPEMLSLADLPSEDVWLENARTKSTETARYYKTDLLQFKEYFGIKKIKLLMRYHFSFSSERKWRKSERQKKIVQNIKIVGDN